MISKEDVIDAHILFFGREVKSEEAIQKYVTKMEHVSKMVQVMLNSNEFKSPACIRKLKSNAVTEKMVIHAFRLILGREPASQKAIEAKVNKLKSQRHLILTMTRSKEYLQNNNIRKFVASTVFNSKARVIYLHIPKTAGKAFAQVAKENYVNACSLSTSGKFLWDAWNESTLIGGHFSYSWFDGMSGSRLFLSVVRDPVDRAISRFNFYRNNSSRIEHRESKGFDHDDFLNTIRTSSYRHEFINNYQCRYLSGKKKFSAVEKAFKKDAFIVGHYEEIDKWLQLLRERLGWTEIELPKVNVAADPFYMHQYKDDKVLINLLKERNREDYKLLNLVKQHGVYESIGSDFDYTPFMASPRV